MIEDTLEIGNKSDNKEIVKKYLDKWYTYRDSKMLEQEYALSTTVLFIVLMFIQFLTVEMKRFLTSIRMKLILILST